MIHQYKSEGLSNRAVARRLGIDRKTVTRHLCQDVWNPEVLMRPSLPVAVCIRRHRSSLCRPAVSEVHPTFP